LVPAEYEQSVDFPHFAIIFSSLLQLLGKVKVKILLRIEDMLKKNNELLHSCLSKQSEY
jgi:hypothetical protein